MVDVSIETPAETEARLRRLMRATAIEWQPGVWALGPEPAIDAIAVVSGASASSWLRRGSAADKDPYRIFRANFPIGRDNSGFVGWLAGEIKRKTGSGVVVVCGYDAALGGVFDYWGVPIRVASRVRRRLTQMQQGGSRDSLDGMVMRVSERARGAEIDEHTFFCFDQAGRSVTARYGGGAIAEGWLAGRRKGSSVDFRYTQLSVKGRVSSGRSTADLVQATDGRWQLVEHFEWADGGTGDNRLEQVLT